MRDSGQYVGEIGTQIPCIARNIDPPKCTVLLEAKLKFHLE